MGKRKGSQRACKVRNRGPPRVRGCYSLIRSFQPDMNPRNAEEVLNPDLPGRTSRRVPP
jgi:hypothetical protein